MKHPGVDKIAFTGEGATAKIIQREAADTMKRLTFELGGKSPNVIFADADLDAAIEGAHFALYFNQGQCCCAGSRLFVEERVHDLVAVGVREVRVHAGHRALVVAEADAGFEVRPDPEHALPI